MNLEGLNLEGLESGVRAGCLWKGNFPGEQRKEGPRGSYIDGNLIKKPELPAIQSSYKLYVLSRMLGEHLQHEAELSKTVSTLDVAETLCGPQFSNSKGRVLEGT